MSFPNWRFSEKDLDRVKELLAKNFSASNPSDMCEQLEELWAKKIGAKHAVTFSSGTATLHACLDAVGVRFRDEVIIPALSPVMVANSVIYQNAIPVFADVEEDAFCIDAFDIERKVTSRTKAIVAVALYGLPCDMDVIDTIARQYGLAVIEDNAESPGAIFNGRNLGTIGDMASFSFENSKTFVCGDGGIITTNNKELASRARAFQFHGYKVLEGVHDPHTAKDVFQDPDYARHTSFGWTYKMPEVACAIGISQVERFDELVDLRVQVAKLYQEVIEDVDEKGLLIPQFLRYKCKHVYWTWAVKFNGSKKDWRKFRRLYMKNGGDGIYACWLPPYLEPLYREGIVNQRFPLRMPFYHKGLCPIAEKLQPQIMQFPTNYGSIEEALPKMDALKKTLKEYRK